MKNLIITAAILAVLPATTFAQQAGAQPGTAQPPVVNTPPAVSSAPPTPNSQPPVNTSRPPVVNTAPPTVNSAPPTLPPPGSPPPPAGSRVQDQPQNTVNSASVPAGQNVRGQNMIINGANGANGANGVNGSNRVNNQHYLPGANYPQNLPVRPKTIQRNR